MQEKQFHGLSMAEVEDRIRMGNVNQSSPSVSKTKMDIVREHTLTYFNFLNLFLAILVASTGRFRNMTFLGVVFLNTLIGIFQELKVKKLIDGISVMTVTKATVIREGITKEISVEEVVKDDIICFESGQQICADCRILESNSLEVNESMVTGESRPVKKQEGDELLSGSYVVSGSCIGKCFHVGESNYAVSLAQRARIKKRASSQMQESIKKIIQIDGLLLFPIGVLLYLSQKAIAGTTFSQAIVNTVAGVIGMIPEGLVLLTSISFVLGVGRLAGKKALVQEMESIEALARVDVLCLDKTGTITTGNLEVIDILLLENASKEHTEQILADYAWAFQDSNSTQNALKKYFPTKSDRQVLHRIPFSSERKYSAVCFESDDSFVLGAPEFLIPEHTELLSKVNTFSEQGIRVLLLGSCQIMQSEDTRSDSVTSIAPIALILLTDEIRKEAPETFQYFKDAGVSIRILSGDNPRTVSCIAKRAGISGAEYYFDARTLPDDPGELKKIVEEYTIFGRVKPQQKQLLVKTLKENGHVVGMTGDGVNDVLALKDADCGIAMAAGSDAAKQVAHIVLLDSNFASMKEIVSEGQTIISNIEKVSALYLTKTIYSILLCLIFIFWHKTYPFIPIQLSWISGISIGIPSFLLTLETHKSSVSKGFLVQVLKISLPAALSLVISLVMTEALSFFWLHNATLTSLFHMVIGGGASLIVVYRVCQPMSRYHLFLCTILTLIFITGILLVPSFWGIHSLLCRQSLFLVPMLFTVSGCNIGFTSLFQWLTEKVQNRRSIK